MTHRIAYYRVSTGDQSIAAQREALGCSFDQEFQDEGISGATLAGDRPGFSRLLASIRSGDELHVFALDRLGRDAIDVQATVRALLERGVTVHIKGIGPVGPGVGEIIVAVLSQMAAIERRTIKARCDAGREAARASLAATGKTHKGKHGLGRKPLSVGPEIAEWRRANGASIAQTAAHFGISPASVKRYMAGA